MVTSQQIEQISSLLKADKAAAEASITQTRRLMAEMGLGEIVATPPKPRKAGDDRKPTSLRGKSVPNLRQWLRRALDDGVLPQPTERLILSARMVREGLDAGYIEGDGHPYRVTIAGRLYAASRLKTK